MSGERTLGRREEPNKKEIVIDITLIDMLKSDMSGRV